MAGLVTLDFGAMMAMVYGLYRMHYGAPVALFEEDVADLPRYSDREPEQ